MNLDKCNRNVRLRLAFKMAKARATPSWVNHEDLEKIYSEARNLKLTVDHIIPLRNQNVCGLHVPWNLQFLTKIINLKKGNTLERESGIFQRKAGRPQIEKETKCPH